MEQCGGGVARNMAEALWRLRGGRTRLLTAVGDDADGKFIADVAPGLLLDGCIVKSCRTPTYAAVLDQKGECLLGLGDMALHNHITVDLINQHIGVLEQAPLVVIDGNVPQQTMDHILHLCHRMKKPVFFEPTDRRKATKALQRMAGVTYGSPNMSELRAMATFLRPKFSTDETTDLNEILALSEIVSQVIDFIIITIGAKGVVTINVQKSHNKLTNSLVAKYYPVENVSKVENVSGAGDCFASGFIVGMLSGLTESQNIHIGFESAKQALSSKDTVPRNLIITRTKKNTEFITYKKQEMLR